MVFEAVVVELLNKFLKQYVENLDTSQLKIGIWGGDVVLNDLKINTSVFDDFNLPIKVKWGKLGKLSMKIPWKNLYASQVVLDIEELLVLLIPCNEYKYDPEKEAKWQNDKKQARLKAVEEARKRESETAVVKQSDGFIEKLVTQIIKNIQIVIRNIHIRYEDQTTNPASPFSLGVTMSNLSATTTANYNSNVEDTDECESDNFICKVVHLEGLAIYMNPDSAMFSDYNSILLTKSLLENIPNTDHKPQNYLYLFGPLSASAFLKLNPKPENDNSNFSIPKIFVRVTLKEIGLAMTRNQFNDIMMFVQNYQRLSAAAHYRKYRPVGIPVIGHAVEWWHFAYNGVVEDIRRRKREWAWANIREHRQMCRKYSELYEQKLSSKKMSTGAVDELSVLENKLNVFNILLLREQAYVQVERTNSEKENKPRGGWLSNWFGYGASAKPVPDESDIVKKIESVMTPQEKEKLYKAIGYDESAPSPNYPPEFVDIKFLFQLDEIKITVSDDEEHSISPTLTVSITTVKIDFEQRPSPVAMRFVMGIGHLRVVGKPNEPGKSSPELITSNCGVNESLVEILYETKPLDSNCDQRIRVKTFPLRIIYHAHTINNVRDIFDISKLQDEMTGMVLSSASLPAFQKITAMGLQYAIEKRTILEVKVHIMPSYIIIPYEGSYNKNKDLLVIMLGRLNIETEENEQKDISVKKLYLEGTSEQEIFSTVLSASYTKFKCELTGVQVLLQLVGEDWVQASKIRGKSPMRFLESTDLVVTIKKSLVTDDARIPKIIFEGQLPSLTLNFSEERFIAFAGLLCSIPSKSNETDVVLKKSNSLSAWSLQSIGVQLESKLAPRQNEMTVFKPVSYVQGIDLVIHFEMKELVINVSKSRNFSENYRKVTKIQNSEEKFLTLRVVKLEIEFTRKTFETISLLKLGGLQFQQYHKKYTLPFVSTKGLEHDYYLFNVEYVSVDTIAPDFRSSKTPIINHLSLNVTPLNVLLNKEALLAQVAFFTHLQSRLDDVKQNCRQDRVANAGKLKEIIYENSAEGMGDQKVMPKGKKFRKKLPKKEIIDFYLDANLEEINILVEFEGDSLMEFSVKGGSIEISTRKSYTNLDFKLKEVFLSDLNPKTLHTKVLESLEKQTACAKITVFNSDFYGSENSVDMSIEAEIGGVRCFFLSLFVTRVLEFLSAFHVQVQTIKEGATVAAQRAKENVIKAYQNTPKTCINIKMTAPILVIPRNCGSREVLIMDLGVLTVKNHITEVNYPSEANPNSGNPVIDSMRLHLQNLKFSRCSLSADLASFENEKSFLVPVSFELFIKRNLSTACFKVIPQFEIVAKLAAVHVVLTHEDFSSIVTILRDNAYEGEEASKKCSKEYLDAKMPARSKSSEHHFHSNHHQVNHHNLKEEEEEGNHPESEESNFHTVVKFMFYMDSFTFDAFTKSCKMSEDTGLARFVLETISLQGRQFSNGSIDTSILLVSCLLDDTRPGKKDRLTRLMERTDGEIAEREIGSSNMKSMIEITYKKKGLDSFVETRVYRFTLILSMDFLHKMKDFFTIETTQRTLELDSHEASKAIKAIENKAKFFRDESERPPTFTINLRLEKPDIVIVENIDSIDTDALVFHMEIIMKFRFAGVRQVITGTITDVELYSCCFNPAKRHQTMAQVIKPFTISVAGSTPPDQGLHVDIYLTEILITINPNTIELLSKCYETLYRETCLPEKMEVEEDYSDLWEPHPFRPEDYWFLKAEEGEDALMTMSSSSSDSFSNKKTIDEILLLAIPSILILVEGVTAKQSKPLLLLRMGFQMQTYNWNTKLTSNSSLTLQMQYYNKTDAAWEPLIEPIEVQEDREKNKKHSYAPWEVNCSVVFGDEGYLEALEPPKVAISISCTDILPITVTRTGVEIMKNLIDTYTTAVIKGVVKKVADLPPFIIKNETGLMAELLLDKSNLQVCKAISDHYKVVKLESNSEVELQVKSTKMVDVTSLCTAKGKMGLRLLVQFPIAKPNVLELPLNLASLRFYPISLREFDVKETWGLVSDVSFKDNTAILILRSIVKVVNYFNEPINIHSLSESGNEAEYVGVVEGNSSFSLPFHAVYNSNKKLFFSVKGYCLSTQPFAWESIKSESNLSVLLQCNSKNPESNDPFFIQAVGEVEEIYCGNSNRKTKTSICYTIHLQPTVKIINSLPVDLIICFQGSAKEHFLQPGNNLQITHAEPGSSTVTLRISNYLEKEWSSKETILESPPEFFIWKFVSYNGLSSETLNLGVHCTFTRKTAVYTIYSPYFMVNKTNYLLSYRFEGSQTVFYHPKNFNLPIMFSPSYRKFYSKKTAFLKVNFSDWSEKFPVDVAGSGGTVECEDSSSDLTYKISISISLTYNSLTKIVTFTPYYVFINETKYAIECQECDIPEQSWLEIPAETCTPFWPQSRSKQSTIKIKPKDSDCVSPPFRYSSTDTCLLRLNHRYGGIFVSIQATQSGTYITFSSYEPGQAPALIINYSMKTIKLFEKDTNFGISLKPYRKLMHAWVSPTGKRKLTLMNPKHMKDVIILNQDTTGQIFTMKGESMRYVTFLDGIQRVLLFTDDVGLSSSISNFMKTTTSGVELICEVQGIGVSLVNNINRTEILYMSFVSSGITWEMKKVGKGRYKRMKKEDSDKMEEAYNKYLNESEMHANVSSEVVVSEKMKVNFETMTSIHPPMKELKRTSEPGVWFAYRLMEDQVMINLKVNKIQVDNQLHDCIFPVILSPVPPPRSVAALYKGAKPFFELSIVKKAADSTGVEQYKYFEILVQEFQVKIDVGFLQQFYLFLAAEKLTDEEVKNFFLKDLEIIEKPLMRHIEVVSSHEQKNFYQFIHFSPLKVHFSFSLAGNIDSGSLPPFVGVMIQSVGITLTDIHDVIFRLSYFERKSVFLTSSQLQSEMVSHYYGQTVRQAYVLLLGLDVIGNPFGLIVGIGEGVEAFFYEPFQGMVHGPSEFATGVAIGCKSLFGRTVGSTAGTLGKLTETLGKGLAVLSLDKEYQLQRMENQNLQDNIQASMARGGRGLVMGVFEGVTGIVKKPIEGAKEEGVGGFFKGMGKGMMGLVTRPVTGVVDFASTSFNAVRRVTGPHFENKRIRPPRFFRDDQLVEPYNFYEAFGNSILFAIGRRKYFYSDKYDYHVALREREVVIITNRRMILAELNELFGTWQEHIAIMWKSMPDRPHCHSKGVAITLPLKNASNKKEKPEVKVLLIPDANLSKEVCKRMVEMYKLEKDSEKC